MHELPISITCRQDRIMPALSAQQALELIRNARADPMGLWPPGLLGRIGDLDVPHVYRALAALLRQEPANVRARAARLLGDAQNPEALEALEPLLADADDTVRFYAVEAVEQFGAVDDMVGPLANLLQVIRTRKCGCWLYARSFSFAAIPRPEPR
jgi:hypothetical protein